ncbi:MAG: cell wall surface anchor family protein [Parcubacteria group bacterium LiPW_41]|nr:MAG: cell wall surface anchor family protein [Parcubacteria group bacterium LiPW_41]
MKYRFFYSFIITIALCGFVLYQNALALNLDTTAVSPGLDGNSNYIFNIAGLSIGTTTKTANTLRVGTGGIIFSDGSTQTAGFLGSSQTVSAGNVSQGVFGYPSASSAFAFPAALGIGINTYAGLPANGLYVAGSVGIGTTAPSSKLHVYGSGGNQGLILEASDTSDDWITFKSGGMTLGGVMGGWATDTGYLRFDTKVAGGGTTEKMRITSTGNVGIGTTSPLTKLHAVGSSATNIDVLTLENTDITSNTTRALSLNFVGRDTVGNQKTVSAIRAVVDQINVNDGYLSIHTRNANTLTEQIRINKSGDLDVFNGVLRVAGTGNTTIAGNVGIGTTNPSSKLDVTTAGLGVTQTTTSGLALVNTTAAALGAQQISPALRWSGFGWKTDVTAGSQAVDFRAFVTPVQGTANPTGYLGFGSSVNGGAYSDNQLVITTAGNVGIGTTSPGEKLEVSGNVKAVSFLYSSDFNLKKDISIIPNALSKVLQLQGVSFKWKTNSEPSIGFIAQDVEKIFPDLVRTDPVTKLKSVQYGNLVAPLVEAVKAQQVQIETYKKNQEDQQKQIDELTEKIKLQVR